MNSTFFSDAVSSKIYTQDYSKKTPIDGVKMLPIKNSVTEEGDFSEIMRLTENGEMEGMPGFKVRQINRTHVFAGSIKAWHVHNNQDEVWYTPPTSQLFVGLWDVRAGSATENQTMRVVLGGGSSHLVYIPHGVAHGVANFSHQPAQMFYYMNQQFNLEQPDENRLPWDSLGSAFWTPERD